MPGWLARRRCAIRMPSSSPAGGMRRSVTTTSGRSRSTAASSDSPSPHAATTSTWPPRTITCDTASRIRKESSATATRSGYGRVEAGGTGAKSAVRPLTRSIPAAGSGEMRGGAPIGVPTARGSANVVSAMSGVLAPAARPARLPVLAGFARGRYAFAVGALAVVYYGAAQLGYALEVAGPVAAVVWLPVGIGIAALYLGGLALWPGVLIGDLLANDYTALPLGSALGQTFGNVLEVLVAVLLLRRLVRSGSPLETVGGVVGMVAAIAAGTAVSATVGSLAQWFGGVI